MPPDTDSFDGRIRTAALGALIFVLGAAAGYFASRSQWLSERELAAFGVQKLQVPDERYRLINPLVGFNMLESKKEHYAELEEALTGFIAATKVSKNIERISVYFRNISNGQWVGIDENKPYDPASLLKVPVMMAYFKLAETDPGILERRYAYTDDDLAAMGKTQNIDLETRLEKNVPYTADELVREMIVRSDNVARYLLLKNGPQNLLDEIFTDLGIQIRRDRYRISAKTYSLFFRTLYNATYLNKPMSEKALELLTETDYPNGLRAGIPPGTGIAQKYGSYTDIESGVVKGVEMHDCGIIYYTPKEPYILCVMTRGMTDSTDLEDIIRDISRLTYEFIQKNPDVLDDSASKKAAPPAIDISGTPSSL